ncbi:MAG: M2 family metallopeptidase [Flavobacteriales bacterium]
MKKITLAAACLFLLAACKGPKTGSGNGGNMEKQKEVQTWLDTYNTDWQRYVTASSEAQWKLNTRIVEGDTLTEKEAAAADEAYSKFTGDAEVIEKVRGFLKEKDQLTPLQVRQLNAILYMAGNNPETAGELVKERIDAQNRQTKALFGYRFMLNGKEITPNEIDEALRTETDVKKRLAVWNASKEVGKSLKPGLVELQSLRNRTVQALDYKDYFEYQVSDYGMSSAEMTDLCRQLVGEVWPLYRELHTWARYTLAEKYKQPVPQMLPAHWLPNRWGQDWTALVQVEGLNADDSLKTKKPEWIVEQGEAFYVSLGFPKLPASFYEKSDLYPLPAGAAYKKNTHASAWHMDYDKDIRSLMSVEPNSEWWETTLHELGHIYYYMSYSNPEVPLVLRNGANRAYHEAFGTMIGLASMQKPFLQQYKLVPADVQTDETRVLLKEALNYVVLLPWAAGTMTEFEHELYARNLPAGQYNKRWWEIVEKCQGIVPPSARGEEYCDAATKTHINDDPAQYYDYALSGVLLFQFHDHIARNILKQDPHNTNYYGNKEVGKFLSDVMKTGATVDWREDMKKHLGSGISAKPMLSYFEPLMLYLKEQNKGRTHTLPEKYSI